MTHKAEESEPTSYQGLLSVAIQTAVRVHADTFGKDGQPYILHPLRLMMQARTPEEKIVAVLHDAIEDTPLTLEDLTEAGFPAGITQALDAVTKRDGEDYDGFVERITLNPLATAVKLLDLRDNMDLARLPVITEADLQRLAKYHRAAKRLEDRSGFPRERGGAR